MNGDIYLLKRLWSPSRMKLRHILYHRWNMTGGFNPMHMGVVSTFATLYKGEAIWDESQLTESLVGPLLGTKWQPAWWRIPGNSPTSDCEMRLAPDGFSFPKWWIVIQDKSYMYMYREVRRIFWVQIKTAWPNAKHYQPCKFTSIFWWAL